MREHFFITEIESHQGTIHLSDRAICKQITSVLRLAVGDEVVLGDGHGLRAVCTISAIERTQIVCAVTHSSRALLPTRVVRIAAAITKRDTFEWMVQKVTELGVTRITPLLTDRTIKLGVNLERLSAIAREAAEQSGQVFLPVIDEPMTIESLLEEEHAGFWCDMGATTSSAVLADAANCVIAIGPEGGWSEDERAQLRAHTWEPVRLAQATLRAETAAIVAVARALQV